MNIDELKKKYNDIKIDDLTGFKRIQVKENKDEEFYQDLIETVKQYDGKISIANGIVGNASKEGFLQAEEIIKKVIDGINPEWTKKQKAAYIHYQMGKLVSYSPDFNFRGRYVNSPMANDTRNIWKSVVSGESVCNGIAALMRNLLSRVGVTTSELSSGTHNFVLAEVEEGNIIIDPTWDLKSTLYGARPMYFGKTYEQLRQEEEHISDAHKLENPPENVVEITDSELREIYHSIGYAKENGKFIFPLLDEVNAIKSKEYNNMEEKLNDFFTMFTQKFPKEAVHLSETRTILETCIYELGIEPENLITKFVYDKDDKYCQNPHLSLFIDDEEINKQMMVLDTDLMQIKGIDISEFDKNFKLHDLNNVQPFWKKYLSIDEKTNEELEK